MSSFVSATLSPHVVCLQGIAGLGRLQGAWNRLADGMPLRSWDWADASWRRQSDSRRLYTLLLCGEGERDLLGIVPLCRESHWLGGDTLRLLGAGPLLVDHQAILALPGWERAVAETAALWIAARARFDWDRVLLTRWDPRELTHYWFLHTLEQIGFRVLRDRCQPRWRIALSPTWNAFQQWLPAETRETLHAAETRYLTPGRVTIAPVHAVSSTARESALAALARLDHSLRGERVTRGDHALPTSDVWHDVIRRSAQARQLRWWEMSCDGRVCGSWLGVSDGLTLYTLLAGCVAGPDRAALQALLQMHVVRQAIAAGDEYFDLGYFDESTALAWRAEPQAVSDVEVVATHASAAWRHAARNFARRLRSLALRLPR